jgi:hypothetical protein
VTTAGTQQHSLSFVHPKSCSALHLDGSHHIRDFLILCIMLEVSVGAKGADGSIRGKQNSGVLVYEKK